jgi:hypothetical protein
VDGIHIGGAPGPDARRRMVVLPCGELHGQVDTDVAVLRAVKDDLLPLPVEVPNSRPAR